MGPFTNELPALSGRAARRKEKRDAGVSAAFGFVMRQILVAWGTKGLGHSHETAGQQEGETSADMARTRHVGDSLVSVKRVLFVPRPSFGMVVIDFGDS